MVGEKIRKIRELKGYSQEYLANQLGISQKTYSKLETNQAKINIDRLNDISKILDIGMIELLAFDEKTIFNNSFHNCVDKNLNHALDSYTNFDNERKALHKHITFLEKEILFLKAQIEKLINK